MNKLVFLMLVVVAVAPACLAAKPRKPKAPKPPTQVFSPADFRATKVLLKTLAKASVTDRPTFGSIIRASKGLLKAIQAQGGCKVDVCFALDGWKKVSAPTYELQKLFVAMTGAMVGWDVTASTAAVQYGLTTKAITPLTKNRAAFLKKVAKSKFVAGPKANMSGALAYCWAQVRKSKNAKKAVVVVGSGLANHGFAVKFVLDVMKREGALVYGVATKGPMKKTLAKELGIRGKDMISANTYADLGVALETTVSQLCGLDA